MIEAPKYNGVFGVWTYPIGLTEDELKEWRRHDRVILDSCATNILMATQKALMAAAVYPNIDRLVITTQTSTPQDNETSYSGTIYTTTASDEFSRSGGGNPYTVAWNITSNTANGSWGSFVLIDSAGNMINRALAGVSKSSGQGKIIQFTGRVD